MTRAACIALAGIAALALLAVASTAAADQLSIPKARERAQVYADSTCAHDKNCAGAGVRSCRRHSDLIVLCRIFDHRKTEEQDNFLCTRLVRLTLQPSTGRVPVTGVSNWDC